MASNFKIESKPVIKQNSLLMGVSGVYNPFSSNEEVSPGDLLTRQKSTRTFSIMPPPDYSLAERKEILSSFKWPSGHKIDPNHFKKLHEASKCHAFLSECKEKKKSVKLVAIKTPIPEKDKKVFEGNFIPLDTLVFLDLAPIALNPTSLRPVNSLLMHNVFMTSQNAIFDYPGRLALSPICLFVSKDGLLGKKYAVKFFGKIGMDLPYLLKTKKMYHLGFIAN